MQTFFARTDSTWTRLSRLATVVATAIVFSLFGAGNAWAHDAIVSSSPEDGETLTTTTDTIVLTFNNTIAEVGGKIRITPQDGDTEEGDLAANGKEAIYQFDTPLANGDYEIAWRVVSSDAHPIEGSFTFTVDDPANATPEPSDSGDPSTSESPSEQPTQSQPPTNSASPTATASAEPSDNQSDSEGLNWKRTGLFAAAGLLVGIIILIVDSKRKKKG